MMHSSIMMQSSTTTSGAASASRVWLLPPTQPRRAVAPAAPSTAATAVVAPVAPPSPTAAAALTAAASSTTRAVRLLPDAKAAHRRPPGWQAPGPQPVASDSKGVARPGETLSFLTGDWRILQLQGGHRWSMDDHMCAWAALQEVQQQHMPPTGVQRPASDRQHQPGIVSAAAARAAAAAAAADSSSSSSNGGLGGSLTATLDLGCGIGSVLLMCAWGLRRLAMDAGLWQPGGDAAFPVEAVGIEAQEVSVRLAERTISYNLGPQAASSSSSSTGGGGARVRVFHQDLRQQLPAGVPQRFQLVTGTPPYITRGAGGCSDKPQKGPCCVETRGGIEEYAQAASAVLAPHGAFVVCCGLQGQRVPRRAARAAAAAGLVITRQVSVVTREGKPPLFAVYAMRPACLVQAAGAQQELAEAQAALWQQQQQQQPAHALQIPPPPLDVQVASGQLWGAEEAFVARSKSGRHTPAWHAACEDMGLPPLRQDR